MIAMIQAPTPNFGKQENIAHNLLFIDGITRCGKSIFSSVIGTFVGCEHLRFSSMLEHMVRSIYFKAANPTFVASSLRTLFNEYAYETMLSRNANFRPDDQSSVLNYCNPKVYIDRLCRDEGENVVEELRSRTRIFPFQTHDLMVHLDCLDSLGFDYKILELYRHPIDNIYSWYTRGWGERFFDDPSSFTLSIEHNGKILPWFCAGYEAEWCELNPMERCARTVVDLLRQAASSHANAKHPERILTLTFEDVVVHTDREIARISHFLNRSTTPWTEHFLRIANCPRVLDPESRKAKLDLFKNGVSKHLYDSILEISQDYEDGVYGLA